MAQRNHYGQLPKRPRMTAVERAISRRLNRYKRETHERLHPRKKGYDHWEE